MDLGSILDLGFNKKLDNLVKMESLFDEQITRQINKRRATKWWFA